MVLVLGRPGAGCSSFLKAITNQRGSFLSVGGDVRYAGFGAEEFGKRYAGQAAYNMEGTKIYFLIMRGTYILTRRHPLSSSKRRSNLEVCSQAQIPWSSTSRTNSS
jgi:hypothetical protein